MSSTFFTTNLCISLSFTVLAHRWAGLMVEWENTELSLPQRPQLSASNRKARRKVIIITSVLMITALFEHALAKPSGYYRALECGITDPLEANLMQAFPEMFSFVPFNIYVGFVAHIVTTFLTFYWNYVDLFVVVVSIGLRQNLKHINSIILDGKAKYHSDSFWHDHWKHYQRVCELVHLFKKKVAFFVVISFAKNLFFICVQLVGLVR